MKNNHWRLASAKLKASGALTCQTRPVCEKTHNSADFPGHCLSDFPVGLLELLSARMTAPALWGATAIKRSGPANLVAGVVWQSGLFVAVLLSIRQPGQQQRVGKDNRPGDQLDFDEQAGTCIILFCRGVASAKTPSHRDPEFNRTVHGRQAVPDSVLTLFSEEKKMKETLLNNQKQPSRVSPGRHVYSLSGGQVMVDAHQLAVWLNINYPCPTGFGWERNKGPELNQLAFIMLVNEFGPYRQDHPVNTQDLRDELIVLLANRSDWTLTSQDIYQACRVILFNNIVKRANEAAYWKKKGVLE